jgi:Na+-driven multidrug efflux pump
MGKSNLQMNTQMLCSVVHVAGTWFLVGYMELSIKGLAISSFITNAFAFVHNHHYITSEADLQDALKVSMMDLSVRQNIGTYIKTGLPNALIILIDWSCFECSSMIAGLIGVHE